MSLYEYKKIKANNFENKNSIINAFSGRPSWLNFCLILLATYTIVCFIFISIDFFEMEKWHRESMAPEIAKTEAMKSKDYAMYTYMKKSDDASSFEFYSSYGINIFLSLIVSIISLIYLLRPFLVIGFAILGVWVVQLMLILAFYFKLELGIFEYFYVGRAYPSEMSMMFLQAFSIFMFGIIIYLYSLIKLKSEIHRQINQF
jgi:hypothetical protein